MDESCDEEPGASSNIELRAQGGGDEEKEQTEADLEQRSGQRIPLSTEESICRGEQGSYRDRGTRLFPTISIEKMCSLNALPNGVLERFLFFSRPIKMLDSNEPCTKPGLAVGLCLQPAEPGM